jgi:hypothetical protein
MSHVTKFVKRDAPDMAQSVEIIVDLSWFGGSPPARPICLTRPTF